MVVSHHGESHGFMVKTIEKQEPHTKMWGKTNENGGFNGKTIGKP
jgi:hypothetical protein